MRKTLTLTDLLGALIPSAVHGDGGVDEWTGGGHSLIQKAFHLVRTQAYRQVEQRH